MNEVLAELPCRVLECDEIWSFCYSKAKNVPADREGEFGVGHVWTWVAIDAGTKLVPTFLDRPPGRGGCLSVHDGPCWTTQA